MNGEDFEIRVPCSLIESPLPDWIQSVWIRIRGYQGPNEWAFCTQQQLADNLGTDQGNISRAIQVLDFFGWLERDGRKMRCVKGAKTEEEMVRIIKETDVQDTYKYVQRTYGYVEDTSRYVEDTSRYVQGTSPSKRENEKPKSKGNTKNRGKSGDSPDTETEIDDGELDYPEGSWERNISLACLREFRKADALNHAIERKIDREGEEIILQEWSDVFRKIRDLDVYEEEVITAVMKWVFVEDDFWVGNGLQSIGSLRSKKPGDELRKFDKIHGKWKAAQNGTRKGFDPEKARRESHEVLQELRKLNRDTNG